MKFADSYLASRYGEEPRALEIEVDLDLSGLPALERRIIELEREQKRLQDRLSCVVWVNAGMDGR